METDKESRIITPLNSTFMLTSILGFITSAFYIPGLDWGVHPTHGYSVSIAFAIAFSIVFVIMFVASLISMTYSPVSEHLQIDEKRRIKLS